MKYAVDPLNLLSPGYLVESSPICRTSTPPRPRDRVEAIVLADAFFVVSSLPPPTSPAGLPLPCLPLHQAPRTIRKCQFLSQQRNSAGGRAGCSGTVFEKVRRRSWSLISSSGSSSCNCSSRSSCRSWSLISSSHQESVITDTPTLEAHHPAVTFFCCLRWKLLK